MHGTWHVRRMESKPTTHLRIPLNCLGIYTSTPMHGRGRFKAIHNRMHGTSVVTDSDLRYEPAASPIAGTDVTYLYLLTVRSGCGDVSSHDRVIGRSRRLGLCYMAGLAHFSTPFLSFTARRFTGSSKTFAFDR